MQTNEAIIQYYADQKMVKALAMFHLLKKKRSHSIIWGYSAKKVAELTGLSEKTVRKYVKELTSYKYTDIRDHGKSIQPIEYKRVAEIKNGNLYLYKIKPKNRLCTIKFKKNTTISEIESLLYAKLIYVIKSQQVFNIKAKKENARLIRTPHGYKEAKKRAKVVRNLCLANNVNPLTVLPKCYDVRMSVALICSKISVSKSKFMTIVDCLKSKGVVMVKRRVVKIGKCSRNEFSELRDDFMAEYGFCWWFKGGVWNNQTNLYTFLDYSL